MITILDYGMGNVASIHNMLRKAGFEAVISGDIADIDRADKLVLPGVGAFDAGMSNLEDRGLTVVLQRRVIEERTPLLGICLGMQLLTRGSTEGSRAGLGWIAADTVSFDFGDGAALRIPHMGWNSITARHETNLIDDTEEQRFYFAHSYHVRCDNPEDVVATAGYGIEVTAVMQQDHVIGVQFHPEKSHRFGMQFLTNFATAI